MSDQIEIQSVLAQLRARAQDGSAAAGLTLSNGEPVPNAPLPDAATLYYGSDICRDPFTSHRPFLGQIIVKVRSFAKELLLQILERQVRYNFANAKIVMGLRQNVLSVTNSHSEFRNKVHTWFTTLERRQADLAARLEDFDRGQLRVIEALDRIESRLDQSLKAVDETLTESLRSAEIRTGSSIADLKLQLDSFSEVRDEQARIIQQLHEHKRAATDQQRRLNIVLAETRKHLSSPDGDRRLERVASERDHLLDSMYFTFEERFRGTREDIRDRLRFYLPYLENICGNSGTSVQGAAMLDIGCGRGEFLELLRDQGIRARGVDFNRVLVEECRKLDLEVDEGECLAYLRAQKDNAFAAVSAIHVIEHLPFDQAIALLDEILRVLKPEGLLILETPNPNNVLVGSRTFYLDPTHHKPLPPELLQFLVEARGFSNLEVHELHPAPAFQAFAESAFSGRLDELFHGPQDYAVIAHKL